MGKISTFYIKNNQIIGEEINLIGEDVNHIKNVLRYKAGDELTICDESEQRYLAKIRELSNECITLDIEERIDFSTEPSVKIILIQGLPKSDKMDLIVQKCTELGVEKIIPVIIFALFAVAANAMAFSSRFCKSIKYSPALISC